MEKSLQREDGMGWDRLAKLLLEVDWRGGTGEDPAVGECRQNLNRGSNTAETMESVFRDDRRR